MTIRTAIALSSCASLLLALAGCRLTHSARRGESVLRYPIAEEIKSFDPALSNDTSNSDLLQNIFEGLMTIDAANRVAPLLAERWDISPDGRTYTFHLRSGVRFQNGRPFTAADVKWSWERALRPATHSQNAANYLAGIVGLEDVAKGRRSDLTGVRVVDDRTLEVRLEQPQGYFPGKLTMPAAWIVCREAVESRRGIVTDANAIGTGAFKVKEYRPNSKVVLIANPDYWGGKPELDRVERPIVVDLTTMHLKYENDEVDISNIVASDYGRDLASPALHGQLRAYPQAEIRYLTMNPKMQPAFKDVRVRKAFAKSIDRDGIERVALHGAMPQAATILPAGVPGALGADSELSYDPAAARKLLADAGYPGGERFPRITLVYIQNDQDMAAVCAIVRDNLRKNLGIPVDLQGMEFVTFNADTVERENIPFFYYGWVADYLDAQDFLSTLFRTGAPLNHYGFSNSRFDMLCDAADRASDEKKRANLYREAERVALSGVAVVPINATKMLRLVKPRVEGFGANLINVLPLKQVRIRQ